MTFMTELLRAESGKHEANIRRVEELLLHKFAEVGDRLNRIETQRTNAGSGRRTRDRLRATLHTSWSGLLR